MKAKLDADLYLPQRLLNRFDAFEFKSLSNLISSTFLKYKNHIFITSTGIAIRCIAPYILSKYKDPAVVVLDQKAKFCISLLSGHIGGANKLAKEVAHVTGAVPVITTATDVEDLPAVDVIAKEKNMNIENPSAIKRINRAIVERETLQVFDPEKRLGGLKGITYVSVAEESSWDENIPGIWVYWKNTNPSKNKLVLHPKCLVVGIGCNRGTSFEEIIGLIKDTFKDYGLSLMSIKALATVEEKGEEEGIKKTAKSLNVELILFSSKELSYIKVPNPSFCVKKHIGIWSVCEAAAIAGSNMGRLIVPKKKTQNTTIAVALEG